MKAALDEQLTGRLFDGQHLPGLPAEMDEFIEAEIKPLERANMQYFDRWREFARTDPDNGGIPARACEDLLGTSR